MISEEIVGTFPLHTKFKDHVDQEFKGKYLKTIIGWFLVQDIYKLTTVFSIGSYFGEKWGLYYAWMTFYTAWLLYLTIIGIGFSLVQIITMAIDTVATPFYCLVVSLWIILFNHMWKRRESELGEYWHMENFAEQGLERPQFIYYSLYHEKKQIMDKIPMPRGAISPLLLRMLIFIFH